MLLSLKHSLENQGPKSLLALSHELKTTPPVVQAMLGHWIRKGRVATLPKHPGCGQGCQRCDPGLTDLYQWVGAKVAASSPIS